MANDFISVSVPNNGEAPVPKRELWEQRIENWKASGLSQKAWCQREQLPLSSLGYWRKRGAFQESCRLKLKSMPPLSFRAPG